MRDDDAGWRRARERRLRAWLFEDGKMDRSELVRALVDLQMRVEALESDARESDS